MSTGQALTKFGQAHFKLATLQDQYSEEFRETYLASLERYRQEVKEYHGVRRKLKSRRYVPSILGANNLGQST